MLRIVADNAIPFVERFFSRLGQLELVDGRQITAASLHDADVLVCRTLTRVNRQLLDKSSLHIVASPTSGIDHIDQVYLAERAIDLVFAPGSNARSVAEYILSSLCVLADQKGIDLGSKKAGIVGCGHVGSQVQQLLETIGIECLLYDPPLKLKSGSDAYCDWEDLQDCDIITMHVPLTDVGPYPTRHMADDRFLQSLKEEVILINSSRGEVVDEAALYRFLQLRPRASTVIDVWAREPAIDPALLLKVDIATPHIAGYSIDGKFRATLSVFKQVCARMGIAGEPGDELTMFPTESVREISLSSEQSELEAMSLAILASYDVRSDAAALRRMLENRVGDRAAYFDDLRNNYPIRREFSSLKILLAAGAGRLGQKLTALGFQVTLSD